MRTIVVGFIAGVLSVLVFHQLGFFVANHLGLSHAAIFGMRPVPPLGIPAIVSAAMWGGLWGIIATYVVPRLPATFEGPIGWMAFIAIAVTLIDWFIVMPIKGEPVGGGFRMPDLVVVPVVHAFWGLGMWFFSGLTRFVFGWRYN